MKIIVQYSGGKDSQATLIWACKKYGVENVEAVFCDTKWENSVTYEHIHKTIGQLGVKLVILASEKYNGMLDLVKKKGRFPSAKSRFCTEELKIFPFIKYLLEKVQDNVLIHQGIRAKESKGRSEMDRECRLFKFCLEPYKLDKEGNPRYLTHRKKEVFDFIEKYDDSILRPFFGATAQEVIDYIIENGQDPNPLYGKGFSRVGCFPCIMSSHTDIKQTIRYFPNTLEELIQHEIDFETTFFGPDYIPAYACSKSGVIKRGKNKGKIAYYPTTEDVIKYLNGKYATIDMFDPEETMSCISMYNSVCE